MSKVESIQEQIQALSPDELAELRYWFLDRDWADWDVQLDEDIRAGRLDALAESAIQDHAAGRTSPR